MPSSTVLSPTMTASSFSANTNDLVKQHPKSQPPAAVGSTWSNVNFDFDNIMGKKDKLGPAPTMNQLKSANTSPVKTQLSNNSNNNNFGQFNAFQ